MITSSSDDDRKSPTSNLKKRKSNYGLSKKFFDLDAVVSGSESDDEQDDGDGVGSFIVPDHESVPASTQQVGSQVWEDTQKEPQQLDLGAAAQLTQDELDKELEEYRTNTQREGTSSQQVESQVLEDTQQVWEDTQQKNVLLYVVEYGSPAQRE